VAGQTWKVRESTVMAGQPQLDGTTSAPMASVSELSYTVAKVFPDGSALVGMTVLANKRGSSLATLEEAPLPPMPGGAHRLEMPDGRSFLVQGRMTSVNVAEQEMMDAAGNADEIALLKESTTTAEYFKTMRNKTALDVVHLPAGAIAAGGKATVDGWAVTRLPDEKVNGTACEVYRAVSGDRTETTWLDAKAGRLMKRTQVSTEPAAVEIVQTRLP
jgi:hypothetical protein